MEHYDIMEHFQEALVPTAPPSAVSALYVMGVPLDQWVLILNALYIVAGLAWLGFKFWRAIKEKKE